jgi:hypothetical protein
MIDPDTLKIGDQFFYRFGSWVQLRTIVGIHESEIWLKMDDNYRTEPLNDFLFMWSNGLYTKIEQETINE